MALDEEQSGATQQMPCAIDWLRDCADLAGVDPQSLEFLAAGARHFSLPAGYLLFEAGSDPDGVYLLASGRLGVKTSLKSGLTAEIERGELVGEAGWLLEAPRSATVVALRDSELLLFPNAVLERVAALSTDFSLALARLCARRLRHSNRQEYRPKRAHIFALVPNSMELDVADLATRLVDELSKTGRTELVWDARATTHTATWFNRIEEINDYVVYVANWAASGWTRQCCRQADVILMAAPAGGTVMPWPAGIVEAAMARGARVELALVHQGQHRAGFRRRVAEDSTRHAAPSHRRSRRPRQGRALADAPRSGTGAVGRRRARFCAPRHHSRAARSPGTDRFRGRRQHRRHHCRRRSDGLER